jgi:hypothetical protein
MKKQWLLTFAIFVAAIAALPAFAQKLKTIDVGKTGNFHIESALRVGGVLLPPGMYQAKPLTINGKEFVIFREVEMSRYGRSMGSLKLSDEIVRLECAVESVDGENKNSKIAVRRNAANERQAVEIWFRNEKLKYILPSS